MSKIRALKNVRVTCTYADMRQDTFFMVATRYYDANKIIKYDDRYDIVLSDGTILHGLYEDTFENFSVPVERRTRPLSASDGMEWLV